jgi:hypothetical protein
MAEPDPFRPLRGMDLAQLEMYASGVTSASGQKDPIRQGQARAELKLLDREHADQQEKSRRDFETALVDKQLKAADKQLKAATDVAWATKWAMVAAIASVVVAALVALFHR